MKTLVLAFVSALLVGPLMAQAPTPAAKPADQGTTVKPPMEKLTVHGGMASIAKEHAFEVVLHKDMALVYLYNMKGEPLGVAGAAGDVLLKLKGGPEKKVELKPVTGIAPGRDYLKGTTEIAPITKDPLPVTIKIKGLQGTEKEVSFDLSFTALSPVVKYTCEHCKTEAADPGDCPKCKAPLAKKIAEQPHAQN